MLMMYSPVFFLLVVVVVVIVVVDDMRMRLFDSCAAAGKRQTTRLLRCDLSVCLSVVSIARTTDHK